MPKIEAVKVSPEEREFIARRTEPLFRHWMQFGVRNLNQLIYSAYLQGLTDCAQMDQFKPPHHND